jgi:hypothetical protein
MNKNIIFLCLCFFSLSRIFAQSFNFPLSVGESKRYLNDRDGLHFLYNADTGWKLFNKLDKQSVIEYLLDRKEKNYTVIQTMLTGFAGETNVYDEPPFFDLNDFETVNNSYFDHVEWVIGVADSLNILLAIAPLWAGCCGEGYSGIDGYISKNGPDKNYDFGIYIGNRYKKFNNILWIIGGDNDPHQDRESMLQLALAIKSISPHQLMTYHAASTHSSTDVWDNESWIDVVMTYTYFSGFDKAWNKNQPDVYEVNFKEYAKKPVKPFFLGESTYEGMYDEITGSALQARKQAYWSVLSGGMGHAYGSPMWDFPEDWRKYLDLKGGNSMKYLYKIFTLRPWYNLLPDSTQNIIIDGAGQYGANDYAIAAGDVNGKYIIAYIPSERIISLRTDLLDNKGIHVIWINPETGKIKSNESFNSTGILKLQTPGKGDWVLILDTIDNNLSSLNDNF